MTNRRTLFVLVAIDLASKALAYLTLPTGRDLWLGSALQLILVLNRTGIGTQALRVVRAEHLAQLPITSGAYLSLAAALLVVRRLGTVRRPVLYYVLALLVPPFVGRLLLPHGVDMSALASVTLYRAAVASLLLASWYVSTSNPWKLMFLFLAAGATGNLLSLLLPPFAIIDFLYSPIVSATVGYQVFNVADAYFLVGLAALPAFAIRWVFLQAKAAREGGGG